MEPDGDLAAAWTRAMRRGDLERAWEVSDRVLARRSLEGPCFHRPRHEQWVWDGRPFDGRRVLVRCYHGLGDTVQFARFLPELARRASRVTVWAPAALLPLLETLDWNGRLLPLDDGTPAGEYEVDLEIMELPHALRVSAAGLAAPVPYFRVPPGPRRSERFSIGLVAGAGTWDSRRSVPPSLLSRLGRVADVALYSLQPGASIPGADDASTPDLLGAASRVLALDLVVTVDTLMAHLSGALGVPTWTLLHADADWRWMEGRDDSPWYPTMRLFRQAREASWESVVERMIRRLEELRGRPLRN